MKTHVSTRKKKKACIRMFIAALFMDKGNSPPGQWINKQYRILSGGREKQSRLYLAQSTNLDHSRPLSIPSTKANHIESRSNNYIQEYEWIS